MRRSLLVVAAGLVLLCLVPHGALALGVKDVIAMSKDGVPDSLIIVKIRHGDTRFDLDAKDLHALREAGVSDRVVLAMLSTEDRDRWAAYRYGPWWPYYSPWFVDFDFGYYAPYYHPYDVGPTFGFRAHRRFGPGFRRR